MTSLAFETRAEFAAAKPREQRATVAHLETRSDDDGTFTVSGYASITDAPYAVRDWLGEYNETIARGAFGKTLGERDDTRWLINHDGIALARTASGTLDLTEIAKPEDDPQGRNQTGLWTEARLDSASPLAQTIRSAIDRGDVSQMSFAFQATRQEWNDDYSQRTVLEAKLFDVSAVTYPANPATSIGVDGRSVEPGDYCIYDECHDRATVEVDLAPSISGTYCAPHAQTVRDAELNRRRFALAQLRTK